MGGYESISGNYIRIDSSGDSEGNFTAYALKPYNYSKMSKFPPYANFTCGHYLLPVGDFHWNQDHHNRYLNMNGKKELPMYFKKLKIDWYQKVKPQDEPFCGFKGEKCQPGKIRSESGFKIAAGLLGSILVILIILTLSIYQKWKIEQEIEGLLWRINPDSLQRLQSVSSIQSLRSQNSGNYLKIENKYRILNQIFLLRH